MVLNLARKIFIAHLKVWEALILFFPYDQLILLVSICQQENFANFFIAHLKAWEALISSL